MRKVSPTTLGQPVIATSWYATGVVIGIGPRGVAVRIDADDTEDFFSYEECFTLRWHDRRPDGDFLIIAKAWTSCLSFFLAKPRRFVRIQAHHVQDGILGRRRILAEYRNGKLVNGK